MSEKGGMVRGLHTRPGRQNTPRILLGLSHLNEPTSWMSLSAAVGTYRTSTGCILPGTLIKGAPSKNLDKKKKRTKRTKTRIKEKATQNRNVERASAPYRATGLK